MEAVVEPAAEAVFDAAVWENGVQVAAPTSDADWQALRNHAISLAEAGNLLMMAPRARDQAGWMSWAQALVDAGVVAQKAADAKSVDAIFGAGGQIYLVCTGCHQQYIGTGASNQNK